jgi:hypothetical protein
METNNIIEIDNNSVNGNNNDNYDNNSNKNIIKHRDLGNIIKKTDQKKKDEKKLKYAVIFDDENKFRKKKN